VKVGAAERCLIQFCRVALLLLEQFKFFMRRCRKVAPLQF